MAGSPVPIARVTRAGARVAVDEDALVEASLTPEARRRRLQVVFTAIEEDRAAIEKENAVSEMLGRDRSAREASTIAHETRRAKQLQWEASNPPVIMDIEAVLSPSQEV
jgi:hypothetical protein